MTLGQNIVQVTLGQNIVQVFSVFATICLILIILNNFVMCDGGPPVVMLTSCLLM